MPGIGRRRSGQLSRRRRPSGQPVEPYQDDESQADEADEPLVRVLRNAKAQLLWELRAEGIQPSSELADPDQGGSTSVMYARITEQVSRDERYDLTPRVKSAMLADALISAMSDNSKHKELGHRALANMDKRNLERGSLAEQELRRLDGAGARGPGAQLSPEYVIQVIAQHVHIGGNGNGDRRAELIAEARATLTPQRLPWGA